MGGLDPLFPKEFKYKTIDIKDIATANIAGHFDSTVKWMTDIINAGHTIYCHCFNGVSRSATIIMAYLMFDHAMPLDAATLLTRKARR